MRIYDHFKPGIPELAALLPTGLAAALKRWEARRMAKGGEPLAWPIKLPVHSIAGLAVLRTLASFKWLRRHGERFATEQRGIEAWLSAVEAGLRRDWALGNELALCGRLVKGYGATNERGKVNLLHLIGQLDQFLQQRQIKRMLALEFDEQRHCFRQLLGLFQQLGQTAAQIIARCLLAPKKLLDLLS